MKCKINVSNFYCFLLIIISISSLIYPPFLNLILPFHLSLFSLYDFLFLFHEKIVFLYLM